MWLSCTVPQLTFRVWRSLAQHFTGHLSLKSQCAAAAAESYGGGGAERGWGEGGSLVPFFIFIPLFKLSLPAALHARTHTSVLPLPLFTPPPKYCDTAAATASVTQTESLVRNCVFASGEKIGPKRKQAGGRKRQLGGDVAAEFRAGLAIYLFFPFF